MGGAGLPETQRRSRGGRQRRIPRVPAHTDDGRGAVRAGHDPYVAAAGPNRVPWPHRPVPPRGQDDARGVAQVSYLGDRFLAKETAFREVDLLPLQLALRRQGLLVEVHGEPWHPELDPARLDGLGTDRDEPFGLEAEARLRAVLLGPLDEKVDAGSVDRWPPTLAAPRRRRARARNGEEPDPRGHVDRHVRGQHVGREQVRDGCWLIDRLCEEEISLPEAQHLEGSPDPSGRREQERRSALPAVQRRHVGRDEVLEPPTRVVPRDERERHVGVLHERPGALERADLAAHMVVPHVCEDKGPWTFRGRFSLRTTIRP